MSLVEFERTAREEWGGRMYDYETDFQRGKTAGGPRFKIRFSDFMMMLNPNCISFKNDYGEWLSFSNVKSVEIKPCGSSHFMLEFIPRDKNRESLFLFVF